MSSPAENTPPTAAAARVSPGFRKKLSPADLADARRLAKAKTWEDRFQLFLAEDVIAQGIFKKLRDESVPRHLVINLLEAASDPDTGRRLQQLLPSKDQGEILARKLRDTAQEIRSFWRPGPFALLSYRSTALSIADSLDEQAKAIAEIDWHLITKRMGFKTFWSQLPIAILCWTLHVPVLVTFVELSHLFDNALRVRRSFRGDVVKPSSFSPRALRQTYARFIRREGQTDRLEAFATVATITLPD
jgi:hypothetical protein